MTGPLTRGDQVRAVDVGAAVADGTLVGVAAGIVGLPGIVGAAEEEMPTGALVLGANEPDEPQLLITKATAVATTVTFQKPAITTPAPFRQDRTFVPASDVTASGGVPSVRSVLADRILRFSPDEVRAI